MMYYYFIDGFISVRSYSTVDQKTLSVRLAFHPPLRELLVYLSLWKIPSLCGYALQ